MAGVHGADQVEGLGTPHLTKDDPVGPEPKRRPEQRPHGYLTGPLGVGWPSFETHHMAFEGQLCGIFDRHHPLLGGDETPQQVQQGGFAAPRPSGDHDRFTVGHRPTETLNVRRLAPAGPNQVV